MLALRTKEKIYAVVIRSMTVKWILHFRRTAKAWLVILANYTNQQR